MAIDLNVNSVYIIFMTAQKTPSPRVARKRKAKIELILDTAMVIAGEEGLVFETQE